MCLLVEYPVKREMSIYYLDIQDGTPLDLGLQLVDVIFWQAVDCVEVSVLYFESLEPAWATCLFSVSS